MVEGSTPLLLPSTVGVAMITGFVLEATSSIRGLISSTCEIRVAPGYSIAGNNLCAYSSIANKPQMKKNKAERVGHLRGTGW